jgi:hypothetical protein
MSSSAVLAAAGRAPTAAERIWTRLARPFDPARAVEALLGRSHASVRALAGYLHATSPEVVALLFHMPMVLRSLGVATTNRAQRCHGEIRGPVQWSETMSARAATAGASDLYICTTTARAYDTPENRILVAALRSIVDAENAIERASGTSQPAVSGLDLARHARRNSALAVRYLDHRALSGVQDRKPNPKAVARVRAGKRARTYLPALAVLDRGAESIEPLLLESLTDAHTRDEHARLADLLDTLDRRGHPISLHAHKGMLAGGPVTYVHPNHPSRPAAPGIHVGDTLLGDALRPDDIDRICQRAGF